MDFLSIKIGLYRNKYISIQVFIIIIVGSSLSYQIGKIRGKGDWELVTGD